MNWKSFFVIANVLWMLTTTSVAADPQQPAAESSQEADRGHQADAGPADTIRELELSGASSPDPMLRYRLWPDPARRKRENATAIVSRAIILSLKVSREKQSEFAEKSSSWSELPLNKLPVKEAGALLDAYHSALTELARIENLMQVEYALDLDDLTAEETVQTLLPELQEMRNLARLLSLRARLAILDKDWDALLDDCRIGFRLGDVAGHSTDFLIGRLVGFAISSTMMHVLEEALQQPECPNLYWALASLPAERLFETRESLEYESILITRVFRDVWELPAQPIGASAARQQLRAVLDQANRTLLASSSGGMPVGSSDLLAGVYVAMMAEPSRDLLAATEQWGNEAYELSAPEAVLRATILKFMRARDRWAAWSLLPAEAWQSHQAEQQKALEAAPPDSDMLVALLNMLTPAVNAARMAGLRSHQQRNWLMTIEAIRMHAAEQGQLPPSLNELDPVPSLPDTVNHQSFGYQRSAPTEAILTRAARYPNDPETTYRIHLRGTE